MRLRPLYLALLLASVHSAAHAVQYVKCKNANGGYTFQSKSCAPDPGLPEAKRPVVGQKADPAGQRKGENRLDGNWAPGRQVTETSRSASLPAPAPMPVAATSAKPRAMSPDKQAAHVPERDYLQRQADEEIRAQNERAMAHNKRIDCDRARQQVRVVRDGRAPHRLDNKGNQHFIADDKLPAEIAAAEQRAAQACQ